MNTNNRDNQKLLIEKLKKVLQQPDAVIFIGAGISRWAGLPSWYGLIEQLAEYMESEGHSAELVRRELGLNDLLQAASYGVTQLTPQQFAAFIRQACKVGKVVPHEIHRSIVTLPPSCFITTNYDTLLEESLRAYRTEAFFQVVTNNQIIETATIIQARANNFVFKPHGDVSDTASIVLSREQYRSLNGEKNRVLDALKTLLVSRPTLFLGFGLKDIDFLYIKDLLSKRLSEKQVGRKMM